MILSFCSNNGFEQVVSKPTRGKNILDIAIVSNRNLLHEGKFSVGPCYFTSDHFSLFGKVNIASNQVTDELICHYSFNPFKLNKAHNDNKIKILANPQLFEQNNVQDLSNILVNNLIYAKERYLKCYRKKKHIPVPLFLQKLAHQRDLLLTKYRSSKDRLVKELFLSAKVRFTEGMNAFCQKNEAGLISKNSKRFWQFIQKRTRIRQSIPTLELGSGYAVTDIEKSNALLQQYDQVFTDDDGKSITMSYSHKSELITCDFDQFEIYNYLKSLQNKSSTGYDGISSALFKAFALPISTWLQQLFTKSMATSTLPNEWLLSVITPVPKKSNPCKPIDFRPVSMTCIASRIMEKIILSRLVDFLKSENLLSINQHGFIKQKSTVTCLLECLDSWSRCFEEHSSVDILYIDISKAFDSISHAKLLALLQAMGVKGLLLKWIQVWLTQRQQCVKVNNTFSEFKKVRSGVPQGSVLGPLLFCLYMTGLDKVLKFSKVKYYADDAKIFLKVAKMEDAMKFQSEIDNVMRWADTWQLRIAFEKCAILHMNPINSIDYQYKMGDIQLAVVNQIRDLGVIIDNKLSFSEHMSTVAKKAGLVSNIIFHNFKCRNIDFLRQAYKAFVLPILEYANETYYPKYIKDIKMLEDVQRSYTRRVPALHDLNYVERLKVMKLDLIEQRRLRAGLLLIYKYLNGKIQMADLSFIHLREQQRCSRGHQQMLHVEIAKSVQREQMLSRLASLWNSLPRDIVESETVAEFRRKIKREDLRKFLSYKIH